MAWKPSGVRAPNLDISWAARATAFSGSSCSRSQWSDQPLSDVYAYTSPLILHQVVQARCEPDALPGCSKVRPHRTSVLGMMLSACWPHCPSSEDLEHLRGARTGNPPPVVDILRE
jgi:hypothetical protein